ncbi:MAG: hypothetical protein ACTSRG_21640 [Candidatus Helarchaeota archaeon]
MQKKIENELEIRKKIEKAVKKYKFISLHKLIRLLELTGTEIIFNLNPTYHRKYYSPCGDVYIGCIYRHYR